MFPEELRRLEFGQSVERSAYVLQRLITRLVFVEGFESRLCTAQIGFECCEFFAHQLDLLI